VKALFTSERMRVWAGGSVLSIDGGQAVTACSVAGSWILRRISSMRPVDERRRSRRAAATSS
jgi:hypothetical protein